MDGVIVVDKSTGWTSHDVVNKMRRIAGTRRIGHLGTLDPAATGVLPLVIGRATRLSQFYTKADKVYEATVRFGFSTSTYDAEGEPTSEPVAFEPNEDLLWQHLSSFRGTFLQTPPAVSAKKIAGTPAYKLARRNIEVELKPVEVTVHSLELLGCEGAEARLRVHCSGGTYLRSIAHDLGRSIGCGAFLSKLRRTRSGDFAIEQAETLEQLEARSREGTLDAVLIAASHLLPGFPAETVDAITAGQIRQGRDFRVSPFRIQRGAPFVKAIDPDGALLAIGELKLPNLYHPMMVL
ncbi:MAG: tRNA pseudouridine(55) synthase TruB [Acidobacteria bacterium]|nr:tRNA pseudouridine(55) synthase TruB [Acidobacteriota bacterium]